MIVQLNEVSNYTSEMVPYGLGRFGVSEQKQRAMLTAFLNAAETSIKARAEVKAQSGLDTPNMLPKVVVSYGKVTKAKPRIAGEAYRGLPGVAHSTHMGQVVKVARNKQGRVYVTMVDENRDGQYTAIRLEGIHTFAFNDADVQAKFLTAADVALGA